MSFPKFQIIRDLYDNDKALRLSSHTSFVALVNAAPREMVALDQRHAITTYNNLFPCLARRLQRRLRQRVMMEFTAYGASTTFA